MSDVKRRWALQIADWMQTHNNLHLRWAGLHLFCLWVLSPRGYGEHLGFCNWLKWRIR